MTPSRKQISARHVRRLRTIRNHLLEMAEQWEDVDQFNVNELNDLADKTEAVAINLFDGTHEEG